LAVNHDFFDENHIAIHMRRMIYLFVLPEASAYIVARGAMHAFTMSVQSADVKKFSVYLQKDDHLMREYVSRVLMMVCEISSSEALAILMKANRDYKNRALCGAWEEPLAKHIHTCLESAGLSVVITPFSGPNAGLLASEPIEVEDAIAVMPREAQAPSPEAPPNVFELEDEADAAARKWALELEQDMEEERRAAELEVATLAKLDHPSVVAYHEHFLYEDAAAGQSLCLVMAYCEGGDLARLIKTHAEKVRRAPIALNRV
jgi:serine/threonine protein kinase